MQIDMNINRREIPVKPANRVKLVTKQADGSVSLTFGDGRTGSLSADEKDMQAFAIYSILADL